MLYFKARSLAAFSAFLTLVVSDASNLNPDGAGCVDPSGYLSCYAQNSDALTTCVNQVEAECDASNLDECLLACGEVQLAANIGCWLTSCWNQVYSCAYQGTVIQYIYGADRVPTSIDIPFYPAPDDAPGRCVCNLGEVVGNYSNNDLSVGYTCLDFVSDGSDAETADCQCCWESSILSNIINICPNNDLTSLDFDSVLDQLMYGYNESVSDSCSVLSNGAAACDATFSIDTFATTYYNPGALPTGFPGTEALSDLSGSVTSPGLGATYTFELFPAYTSTIVAAAYNAENAAGTGVAGTTSAAGGGVIVTGTALNTQSTGTQVTGPATNSHGTGTQATGTATKTAGSTKTGTTPANVATAVKTAGATAAARVDYALAGVGLAVALGINAGLP